jgi:hypothetical protein
MCPISRIKKGVSLPNRRRFMRKDRFKKDQVGVAAVIGTIMALLVFLTFLTVLVTTWIPVTMKDNERNHMNEVVSQFSDMKSGVDNMMVYTTISGKPSLPTYQAVTLGAPGVPAFASPTAGFLSMYPKGTTNAMMVTTFTEETSSNSVSLVGGGSVQMYAPNRYYVQQWVAYENGGILLKQDDGQVFRAAPSITLSKDGNSVNMDITQIDLIGANSSVGGTGIEGLNLEVVYVDSQTYHLKSNTPFIMRFDTNFGQAYYDYFNTTMAALGLPTDGSIPDADFSDPDNYYYSNMAAPDSDFVYWSIGLVKLNQGLYEVSLEIRNPSNVNALPGTLVLNQAFVNVELST